MTTLAEIQNVKAYHLPVPGAEPVVLSTGTLYLSVIPANPPSHPSQTIALSVGASSFPVLPNTPVQKIEAKEEHPRYAFSPLPADGGAAIGRVKIVLSPSQTEWEQTELLVKKFEEALKANGVWDERVLFVDDEWETTTTGPKKGWGEALASNLTWAGDAVAQRLGARTDEHISTTNPTHPAPPSEQVAANAKQLNSTTGSISESADTGAKKVGQFVHDKAHDYAHLLPESVQKLGDPVAEQDKGEFRKLAETGWTQATFAAKGLVGAATTIAGAVSQNAHRAVEHNFGKEADGVAQDIGQSGANVGATAVSATEVTSGIVQGANATSGVYSKQTGA